MQVDDTLLNLKDINAGKLIIGNHDSLMLYGCSAQNKLREFSKTISSLISYDNDELEDSINDVLANIEDFQNCSAKKDISFFQTQKKQYEIAIKNYNTILVYMDKMTVCLQMQQAQLLKDLNIFEQMKVLLNECNKQLESDINAGEQTLVQAKKRMQENDEDEDLLSWIVRLERRLETLRISHTVSLQSMVQLKVMSENHLQLVDKIIATISGMIPIWRNQTALLLGIEKHDRNLEIQNKISNITTAYINNNVKEIKRKSKNNFERIDIDKVTRTNYNLKSSLTDLLQDEKNDTNLRLKLNQLLQ